MASSCPGDERSLLRERCRVKGHDRGARARRRSQLTRPGCPLTGSPPYRWRAQVAELVDALVSGTSGESRGGSSPLLGTIWLFTNVRWRWTNPNNQSILAAASFAAVRICSPIATTKWGPFWGPFPVGAIEMALTDTAIRNAKALAARLQARRRRRPSSARNAIGWTSVAAEVPDRWRGAEAIDRELSRGQPERRPEGPRCGPPEGERRRRSGRGETSGAGQGEARGGNHVRRCRLGIYRQGSAGGPLARDADQTTLDLRLADSSHRSAPRRSIEPHELLAVPRRQETKGNLETARRTRGFASRVLRYAIATARAKGDPAALLLGAVAAPQSNIWPPSSTRSAPASYLGDRGLYRPTSDAAGARPRAHVFVRPGELRQAEWSESTSRPRSGAYRLRA